MSSKFVKIDVENKTADIRIISPRLYKPFTVRIVNKDFYGYCRGTLHDIPYGIFLYKDRTLIKILSETLIIPKKRANKKNGVITLERDLVANISFALNEIRNYIKKNNKYKLKKDCAKYIDNLYKGLKK